MKTILAVFCAVSASVLFNYGIFIQKKAVDRLPKVGLRLSWSVFKAFLTNKPWLGSLGITTVGGGFYAVAVTLAPVSIVQPIVGSGVALLAYLAVKNLGERLKRYDFGAIAAMILGVGMIGFSVMEGVPENIPYNPGVLWIFTAIVYASSVILPFIMGKDAKRLGAALGVSVGLLFGLGAIFSRLLLVDWSSQWQARGILVLFSSVFLIALGLTNLPAIVVMQAALQRGMASVVVPIVGGLSQLVPIVGGMVALNEELPRNAILSVVRIAAFALILAATVVLSYRAEKVPVGHVEARLPDFEEQT